MPTENTEKGTVYLIDASAFVTFENLYPIDSWKPVWDFLFEQVDLGIIITIDDVIQELEKLFYDRKITEWVKKYRNKIKFEKTKDHFEHLTNTVYPKCDGLLDPDFTGTLYADPELIAVASLGSFVLVTDEERVTRQPNTNPLNLSLPNHCDTMSIPCICGRYGWPELLKKLGLTIGSVTKTLPTLV